MHLSQILRSKGSEVVTTEPSVTVLAAIRTLVERNIGALVVVEDDRTVGIITERDILRFEARDPSLATSTAVSELMTRDLITARSDDSVHHAMEIMTKHRVRHLPIVDGDGLAGIISIGDVVNHLRKEVEEENHHLKSYISTAG